MKLTPKKITLIVMCAMLAITLVMAAIVIAKVAPVFGALLGTPDGTQTTVPPTTTGPVTTAPETTDAPTTVPETTEQPTTQPVTTEPSHQHDYSELTEKQEVSCTEPGYSIYACECGATEMRDHVDPTGHRFGPGKLVSATCTEPGYTERKCSVCGEVELSDEKEPLEHDFQLTEEKEVSCEEGGYTEYTCSRSGCGETKRENETEALGHEYGDWELTREPSEGVNGLLTSKCTREGCDSEQTQDSELNMLPMAEKTELCVTYTVEMRAKDSTGRNVPVYTYVVTDYGFFEDIDFNYDAEFGLLVTFTDPDGVQQQYALTDSYTLSINTDGKPGAPKVEGNGVGNICYSYEMARYDGGTFSIGETRGKVTVLFFWGTWSQYGVDMLKNESPRISEEYGDKVAVVAIHTADEYGEDVAAFVEENGLDAAAIYCRDGNGENYHNMLGCNGAWPYAFILDEDGVIVSIVRGAPTYWEMKDVIDDILAE